MTNKKEHKILRKTLSLALTMLVSILGLPLAKPQQVSATETSDPKYLSSITMDATASSSWDSKYSTSVYDDIINNYDNYTSSSPLEIDSAEKLAAFAGAVNVGKRNFNGKYVKLTNDIDLGGTDPTIEKTTSGDKFSLNITGTASNVWVPIGNYSVNFRGTFDGDGHEVSNMTVLMKQTDSTAHAGLFGYVLRGSIKNTGVKGNVYASSSSLSSSIVYAGGLVGYISVVSSISTSYATCNVYASSSSAIVYASGLAGVSYSNISNSYATGNAYAYSSASDYGSYAGGLVSFAGSSSHSISNSYATGNVYASASSGVCAGGLVGYDYSSISNSYATGNVYASASSGVCAGGLVGQSASDDSISNSYYYFKATIDAGTTGTKTSYGTGLTLEQITGNRKGRAKDNMTGFSEDNWEFPGDNGLIKYLPRVKGITYNETTNPAPRLVGIISSDFDFKAPANLTYDGSAKEATVTSKISEIPNDKITIKYYSSTGTNLTSAPIEAGTYIVKIDVAACDKYEAQTDITADHWTFTIAKADPTINSIATTATYAPSLTLKDVPYPSTTGNTPGSWSWTYPSSSIVAGTYTYSAKYTPTDTTNYNSVAKSITVTVNKADPTIGSTSTTAAYKSGLILGNVTPPPCGLELHGRLVDVA